MHRRLHEVTTSRAGVVLPLAIFLITLLALLGYMFLSYSLHSKNIMSVFYRDDMARIFAESAAAEFRAGFTAALKSDTALATMLETPGRARTNVVYPLTRFPETREMMRRLAAGGLVDLTCTISVKDLDDRLVEEGGGTRKYGNEYQATLRLDFEVTLSHKGKQRRSRFVFEHDLKNVCLRSNFANRPGRGYFTSATNDYILYIRDALGEFNQLSAKSLNNDSVGLAFIQPNSSKLGKIFLGCGTTPDADKYVFININEKLQHMMPDPPPPIEVNWNILKQCMPTLTGQIEQAVRDAAQQVQTAGGNINFFPDRVKGTFTLDYKPLVPGQTFWQALMARIRAVFEHFFNKVTGKDSNKEKGVQVLGEQDADTGVCQQIQGNLRQRFWQTSAFEVDLTNLTDNAQVNDTVKQKCESNPNMKVDVKYFTSQQINGMTGTNKELYDLVKLMEDRDKTVLKSQPNEMFPFKIKPRYDERNPPANANLPALFGKNGPEQYPDFMPFTSYLLRSHIFRREADLYDSALYDASQNVLRLNGLIAVEQPLALKKGLRYQGKGIIVGLSGIKVQGSFTRVNQNNDGPCILYTVRNDIECNTVEPGAIEASLVALDYRYGQNAGYSSMVDFNLQPAVVTGNIVADRLGLDRMAAGGGRKNTVTYDPDRLNGPDLYNIWLGPQLRTLYCEYDRAPTPP